MTTTTTPVTTATTTPTTTPAPTTKVTTTANKCGYAILDTMQSRCSPEWADDGEKACKAAATQLGIAFSGQTCTQAAYGCLKRANGVQWNACPQVKDVDTAIYNQGYPICLSCSEKTTTTTTTTTTPATTPVTTATTTPTTTPAPTTKVTT